MLLKNLFYLSVLSLTLGQFSNFFAISGSKIYLFDVVILLFSTIGTLYFLITRSFLLSKGLISFYIFIIWAIISLVFNSVYLRNAELFIAFFYLLRFLMYVQGAVIVYNLYASKLISKKQIVNAFIFSGVSLSILGFIQFILLPDFSVLDQSLGWDPHKNRLASTFFDPNFAGGYLVGILFLLIFYKKNYSKSYLIYFLIILSAILLTFSRSSWGMLAISVLIYGLIKNPKIIIISLVIGFLAYFAVPRIQTRFAGITDPADSASFRLISWKNTLEIAQDNLVFGVGYNAFKKAQINYGFLDPDTRSEHSATGADSSLLLVLATTGIIGFILFIFSLFFGVVNSKSLFVLILISSLMLHSQFVNSLLYPQILFFWLISIGNKL